MSEEIDSSSSSSTDPPSVDGIVAQPLKPLFVHIKEFLSTASDPPKTQSPRSMSFRRIKSTTSFPPSSVKHAAATPSTIYTLTNKRSRNLFIEERIQANNGTQTFANANPMALHLARRQAQAARIMAGSEAEENTIGVRPCRLDLQYKSPRRLKHVFRQRTNDAAWKSEYIGDAYYPMEVAQELSEWKLDDIKRLPSLIVMDSPERVTGTTCCKICHKPPKALSGSNADNVGELSKPEKQVSSNKGLSDEDLEWALKRSCRVRKPWPTIVERVRKSRSQLRYAGIKLLAGLLEARLYAADDYEGNIDSTMGLAAIRTRPRSKESCIPERTMGYVMPLIAPLQGSDETMTHTPKTSMRYTLISETIEKATAHLNTLGEYMLQEVMNSLTHLNLNQLAHLRMALPIAVPSQAMNSVGALKKTRLRDLIRQCEQYIADELWKFLNTRCRPSSAIYDQLLTRNTLALMEYTLFPKATVHHGIVKNKVKSQLRSYWGQDSNAPRSTEPSQVEIDQPIDANGYISFVNLPEFKQRTRQHLGMLVLETMGALASSENTRGELIESPPQMLSDQQSWWLLFTKQITSQSGYTRAPNSERCEYLPKPGSQMGNMIMPPDVIPDDFDKCYLRLPALELAFQRPNIEEDLFTVNELVKPECTGGSSVWSIRSIPKAVEDLDVLAPQDPSAHVTSLALSQAFISRRAKADAHAIVSRSAASPSKSLGIQRLRTMSNTRHVPTEPRRFNLDKRTSTLKTPSTIVEWLPSSPVTPHI